MKKYTMVQYNHPTYKEWDGVLGLCYNINKQDYWQKKWFIVGSNFYNYIDNTVGFMRETTLHDLRIEFTLIED